jgi:hypothetical protein
MQCPKALSQHHRVAMFSVGRIAQIYSPYKKVLVPHVSGEEVVDVSSLHVQLLST